MRGLFTSAGSGKRSNRRHEGGRGHSIGTIARRLQRAKSTVSRELTTQAPCRAGAIRRFTPPEPINCAGGVKPSSKKIRFLKTFVYNRLAGEMRTPEQISGWLKGRNEPRLRAVGCETIYAFIYRAAQKAEQLWRYLTRHHKRRRPPRSRPSRDTINDRVSIHERPETIAARTEAGHWEGDLIICKRTRPVLVLHERKSRVTLVARLIGKTAAETISMMLAVFARIKPALRKSITFDNDTAFAQHALLKTMRAMTLGFAMPMRRGRRAESKTPMADYDDGCRVTSISTKCPTKKSRTSSSPPISPPENASGSRRHSRQSSKSLAKTCKSGSHKPVAPRSRIRAARPFASLSEGRSSSLMCAYHASTKRLTCPRVNGSSATSAKPVNLQSWRTWA